MRYYTLFFILILFYLFGCKKNKNSYVYCSKDGKFCCEQFYNQLGKIDSIHYKYKSNIYIVDYANSNSIVFTTTSNFKEIDEVPRVLKLKNKNAKKREIHIKFKYTHCSLWQIALSKNLKVDSFRSEKINNQFILFLELKSLKRDTIIVSALNKNFKYLLD
jgi:hypothetical protein